LCVKTLMGDSVRSLSIGTGKGEQLQYLRALLSLVLSMPKSFSVVVDVVVLCDS